MWMRRGSPAAWRLDANRMQQVLHNLLQNALQAAPGERVEVAIGVERGVLVYRVRDRGGGIPEADLEKIFEPFHTGRIRGTGLGLALARRIVELHGGVLEAHNHARGGAEFVARIPRG